MKALRVRGAICLGLVGITVSISASPAAAAIVPAPAWGPIAVSGPTNLPPGGEGIIAVYLQNVGGIESSGTITVTDALPAGILTTATPKSDGSVWSCSPGAGQSTIECTLGASVGPGLTPKPIEIPVAVDAGAETVVNVVHASGGGALPASYEAPITVSATPAKPGVAAFSAATYNADGTLAAQAGSHPYVGTSAIFVNTVRSPTGVIVPAGDPKTIAVKLPPGFLGNPTATPRCTEGLSDGECPIDTQVGLAQPVAGGFGGSFDTDAVHSVEAPVGYPAKFTFSVGGNLLQANAIGVLRSDEDYGLTVESANTPQIVPVYGVFFSFWGAPADHSHDGQRCVIVETHVGCGASKAANTAFVTMPMDCALEAAQPPLATLLFDTWLDPGNFAAHDVSIPPVTGCDQLKLAAGFTFKPEEHRAATPSAFTADLSLPQDGLTDPTKLATPPPRRSTIAFPAGVTLNPAAADGLATCSLSQIGYRGNAFPAPNRIRFNKEAVKCPNASKVGTVQVETALLDNPLHGSLYLAAEHENPFGSLLGVYLVVEDSSVGIVIKLPGEMQADPVTGRLSAVFDDLPQTAFGDLKLTTEGGDRAPLATPDTCGTFTTRGTFMPWSAPESGPDTITEDSFAVSSSPNGGPCANSKAARLFSPVFSAGTASSAADTYAPLQFKITRKDGEQELRGLQITLPPGLTGKLAGIATCSVAQIAAAEAKSGKAEQANPSCPSSSQLGTVTSGVGVGNAPFYVGGKAYLAGPYKGAPLSVVTILPAVAGPFDLGVVVVRAAAYLDPETARLTAVSDPLPTILQGIPVALRSIKVNLDRPGFTLTPTSCSPMSITAKLTGAGADTTASGDDVTSSASERFQVGGCENLAFKPAIRARLSGGTKRNDHPALRAELTYPPGLGYANIAFAQVALPHSEFLDQGHIDTVCTKVQFAANACPAGSIYGHAEATTPLLDEPLSGNVYLRSSSNKLPDLVVALKGPPSRPIEAVLDGRVDSIHGGIRNTFEMLPDVPVSKFVLSMKGGNKGLLVNSRNLCGAKRKPRMTVRFIAQNGKRADQTPVLGDDCKKKGQKRHKRG